MVSIANEFRPSFVSRNASSFRTAVRRLASRRVHCPEPAPLELFPFEQSGPAKPPERVDEECERWDGLS